jgi:hypothetical protein
MNLVVELETLLNDELAKSDAFLQQFMARRDDRVNQRRRGDNHVWQSRQSNKNGGADDDDDDVQWPPSVESSPDTVSVRLDGEERSPLLLIQPLNRISANAVQQKGKTENSSRATSSSSNNNNVFDGDRWHETRGNKGDNRLHVDGPPLIASSLSSSYSSSSSSALSSSSEEEEPLRNNEMVLDADTKMWRHAAVGQARDDVLQAVLDLEEFAAEHVVERGVPFDDLGGELRSVLVSSQRAHEAAFGRWASEAPVSPSHSRYSTARIVAAPEAPSRHDIRSIVALATNAGHSQLVARIPSADDDLKPPPVPEASSSLDDDDELDVSNPALLDIVTTRTPSGEWFPDEHALDNMPDVEDDHLSSSSSSSSPSSSTLPSSDSSSHVEEYDDDFLGGDVSQLSIQLDDEESNDDDEEEFASVDADSTLYEALTDFVGGNGDQVDCTPAKKPATMNVITRDNMHLFMSTPSEKKQEGDAQEDDVFDPFDGIDDGGDDDPSSDDDAEDIGDDFDFGGGDFELSFESEGNRSDDHDEDVEDIGDDFDFGGGDFELGFDNRSDQDAGDDFGLADDDDDPFAGIDG